MKTPSLFLSVLAAIFVPAVIHSADQGPVFYHNYREALAQSKSSGKPLILIFSASWCPACQQMKNNVYPSKSVRPFHDSFVWAYLDADDPSNGRVLNAYGVSEIPHIEFLTKEGRSIGHFADAVSPEEFVGVLKKVLSFTANPKNGQRRGGSGSQRSI